MIDKINVSNTVLGRRLDLFPSFDLFDDKADWKGEKINGIEAGRWVALAVNVLMFGSMVESVPPQLQKRLTANGNATPECFALEQLIVKKGGGVVSKALRGRTPRLLRSDVAGVPFPCIDEGSPFSPIWRNIYAVLVLYGQLLTKYHSEMDTLPKIKSVDGNITLHAVISELRRLKRDKHNAENRRKAVQILSEVRSRLSHIVKAGGFSLGQMSDDLHLLYPKEGKTEEDNRTVVEVVSLGGGKIQIRDKDRKRIIITKKSRLEDTLKRYNFKTKKR